MWRSQELHSCHLRRKGGMRMVASFLTSPDARLSVVWRWFLLFHLPGLESRTVVCRHAISYTREGPGKSDRHRKSEHPNPTAQQTNPFVHHSWFGRAPHPDGSVPFWKLDHQHLLLYCLLEVNFMAFCNWCACLCGGEVSGCDKVLGQCWGLAWKPAPSLRSRCCIQIHGKWNCRRHNHLHCGRAKITNGVINQHKESLLWKSAT